MSCTHLDAAAKKFKRPNRSQLVHREECTLCFDGQDGPDGVVVCLQCFNGGCLDSDRKHAYLHSDKCSHPIGVVIKRTPKDPRRRVRHGHQTSKLTYKSTSPPPLKRLAINAPSDNELYDYTTSLRCFKCSRMGEAIASEHPNVTSTVAGIMSALSSSQQSEVKAWEEEIIPCEHTLTLYQQPLIAPGSVPTQCTECDLTSNLWLCLTCGLANCGRQQMGGDPGNGHALDHFHDTGHSIGVKFGTITPEGTGDIYCYNCDDARIDPGLPNHLQTFGISVQGQAKTEKSMTELQLEHNLKFDFSMTGDDGRELRPMFGKGLTGLKNLGNSCYMASVMQTLLALPAFRNRYFSSSARNHSKSCDKLPADCLECQMLKLADGLISGRYSVLAKPPPVTNSLKRPDPPKFQEGVRPAQFKALIGKGHSEFSTMRQQDSQEFFLHVMDKLRKEATRLNLNPVLEPTKIFQFGFEERLECNSCHRVGYKESPADDVSLPVEAVPNGSKDDGTQKYKSISLEQCFRDLTASERLTDYKCEICKRTVTATKSTKFKTFPEVLVLHMRKFQLINWMPTKLDIPLSVPDTLKLDSFLGRGRQPGERELDVANNTPQFNAEALASLQGMGFPILRCQKALLATGNRDAEGAMNWLFQHMDDPDIDAPISPRRGNARPEPPAAQIQQVTNMGFTRPQAIKALSKTHNNVEQAVGWLFENPNDPGEQPSSASAAATPEPIGGSARLPANYRLKAFISHKGPSVHSGHYVTSIRQPQGSLSGTRESSSEWVLFNDEKVVRAAPRGGEEMRAHAYLYIYERV